MFGEDNAFVYNLNSLNPSEPARTDKSITASGVASRRPKDPRLGKRCDATIVITERLAQNFLCVLAQHGRRHGIDDRRLFETDRLFDVRHEARGRVRVLFTSLPLAHTARL